MRPEQLQLILTETIDHVIDTEAFNVEVESEKQDACRLQAVREQIRDYAMSIMVEDQVDE